MKHALLLLLLAAAGIASAQTTYSWTDLATGSTIYLDQPPPPGVMKATKKAGKETGDEPQQSYAVRTAAEKFPVTLQHLRRLRVEACQNGRICSTDVACTFQEKTGPGRHP